MAPSLLIGHSLGGAAVLRAAPDLPSAKAVVTIGAPFDPEHVTHNFGEALETIHQDGEANVNLGGRPFTIKRAFVEDVAASNLAPAIASMKKALLHPKSFVTLDNADHLVSASEDAEYAAEVIAAWAGRYLKLTPPAPPPGAPEGIVRVSEADAAGFLQDVNSGPYHHTLADEPLAYGGTNQGMSPYGFISAGLGACTSMTIRMYARRKGWPLTHVSVDVCHDKVHAQDCRHCVRSQNRQVPPSHSSNRRSNSGSATASS
ncbi:hypothetical protein GQR58_000392 [Nymphon striatum]|nr:hypothetical protein GQR58_000392 [Nymphon striatum]